MSLTMYTNSSDNRAINKNITLLSTVNCTFKDNTSMETPAIVISREAYNSNCNYVYLSDTGRYYYVVDVEFSKQSVIYKLKVDVLKSFASDILQCEAVALRSATQYNNYLDDPEMSRLAYSDIYLKKFPNSLNKNLNLMLVVGGA